MSSVVESLISLGKEIIQTDKDIDFHSKKLFELQTASKSLSEKWDELTDQLTEDEKIQLSQKDIKEQEDKLIQMKSDHSKSYMEKAVKRGDLEEVRFLGEEGVRSDTYIDIAAEEGHFGIVKYMLSKHDSKENWETCAIYAAKGGHIDIVKYCSDNIVKGKSMFRAGMMKAGMNAAEYGHLDILKFIMLRDVDRDGYLKSAKKGGHQDVIDYCEEQVEMNPFRHMLDYVDRDTCDP
uniref:Ankyrin repeat protein n=1 Tax=Pithovirus LCPAC401 TaxID=2506595 RepID=A0A481ZBR6_9VIRU|nr:MAG: ankyrin repeat protein [Pithovirus LCPAC401]